MGHFGHYPPFINSVADDADDADSSTDIENIEKVAEVADNPAGTGNIEKLGCAAAAPAGGISGTAWELSLNEPNHLNLSPEKNSRACIKRKFLGIRFSSFSSFSYQEGTPVAKMPDSMTPKEWAAYQEWKTFGDEYRAIRNSLQALLCDPQFQTLMTIGLADALARALNHLEKFAVRAEDRMFRKVKPAPGNDHLWLSVFYG